MSNKNFTDTYYSFATDSAVNLVVMNDPASSSSNSAGAGWGETNVEQLKYPQFSIPPLPKLVDVPIPKPVKKLPPVGYDMRALRKQLETLYSVSSTAGFT